MIYKVLNLFHKLLEWISYFCLPDKGQDQENREFMEVDRGGFTNCLGIYIVTANSVVNPVQ